VFFSWSFVSLHPSTSSCSILNFQKLKSFFRSEKITVYGKKTGRTAFQFLFYAISTFLITWNFSQGRIRDKYYVAFLICLNKWEWNNKKRSQNWLWNWSGVSRVFLNQPNKCFDCFRLDHFFIVFILYIFSTKHFLPNAFGAVID
jgi:hypothetical protein